MTLTRLFTRRSLSAVGVSAILGLGAAACGSSSSSSSSTAASGSSSASSSSSGTSSASAGGSGIAAVQAIVQAHTKDPTQIAVTVPITKPIPKGKHLVYVNCGAPACTQMGDSLTQAAQVLGWTVSKIIAMPTPAGIQAAFNAAITQKPDAVVSDALTAAAYQHQIQQLHAAHAFVISNNGTDATGQNGIDLQTGPIAVVQTGNRLLADKVIADNGGKGNVGEVFLTGFPIIQYYAGAFESEIKAKCPSCTLSKLEVQPTDIGKDAAGKIANFLRVHPDIKQVYLTYDTLALGLDATVKGAGVPYPKLYSWAIDDSGLAAVKAGQRAAVVPACYPEIGWTWADGLARLFTGGSIKQDELAAPFPIWSNDYHNVPTSTSNAPCNPNYQAQFKALWHK